MPGQGAIAADPRGQSLGLFSPEDGAMRHDPPEAAIFAMLLLTAIAVGLVLFVELVTKNLR